MISQESTKVGSIKSNPIVSSIIELCAWYQQFSQFRIALGQPWIIEPLTKPRPTSLPLPVNDLPISQKRLSLPLSHPEPNEDYELSTLLSDITLQTHHCLQSKDRLNTLLGNINLLKQKTLVFPDSQESKIP